MNPIPYNVKVYNKFKLIVDYKYAAINNDTEKMKNISKALKKYYNVDVKDRKWVRENVEIQRFYDNNLDRTYETVLQ